MKRFTVLGLVLIGQVCGAQQLTLDQAIQIALQGNKAYKNAALQLAELEEKRASTKTQFLPSARILGLGAQPLVPFNFSIAKGALGTDSGLGSIPEQEVQLHTPAHPIGLFLVNVTQPLSGISTIRRELKLLDLDKQFATEQLRLERQTLIREIRQLYYGIETLEASLRAARESVKLFQEVERITEQYLEKRQVLDIDFLEAQLHLAKATTEVLDLDNQRQSLKEKLNSGLGRDIHLEFSVPAEGEAAMPELLDEPEVTERRALAERPEVRQADLQVQQAQMHTRLIAESFNPTIAAEFIGSEITNVNALLPRQVGVVGLSLNWEPFTWGRRKHDLAVARVEAERAANAEQNLKSQVAIDAVEQWRRLKLARARLHVADLSRKLAGESLRVAQKQYSVEFTLLKTVLEAQSKLEAANGDYQKASGELWSARADYERAEGLDR